MRHPHQQIRMGFYVGTVDESQDRPRYPRAMELGGPARLTGIERLCYDLVLDAVLAYTEGDEEAEYWLFREGEVGAEKRSEVSLSLACDVLGMDLAHMRRRIKEVVKARGLSKVAARAYVASRVGGKECVI